MSEFKKLDALLLELEQEKASSVSIKYLYMQMDGLVGLWLGSGWFHGSKIRIEYIFI